MRSVVDSPLSRKGSARWRRATRESYLPFVVALGSVSPQTLGWPAPPSRWHQPGQTRSAADRRPAGRGEVVAGKVDHCQPSDVAPDLDAANVCIVKVGHRRSLPAIVMPDQRAHGTGHLAPPQEHLRTNSGVGDLMQRRPMITLPTGITPASTSPAAVVADQPVILVGGTRDQRHVPNPYRRPARSSPCDGPTGATDQARQPRRKSVNVRSTRRRRPAPANEGGGRRRVPAVVVHQPRPKDQPGAAGAGVAVDHRCGPSAGRRRSWRRRRRRPRRGRGCGRRSCRRGTPPAGPGG